MDNPDLLLLARAQFGLNIGFHILFPSLSIALAWILVYFRIRYARGGDAIWLATYKLWVKIFALTFAMGVVTGITMSFQFGTNWPGFMKHVGNIAGPLLAFEVLTAFFLEASFLGIMLFGHGRVSERVHLIATFLVAFGTTLSAFWIIALNSWMQTPAGYEIIDGVFHATSWSEVIFNPSMPYRLVHMLLASFLTVAFLMAGVSAWQLLRGKDNPATRPALSASLIAGAALIPVQIFMGDLHGLNTLEHQPAKVAAMEALWKTQRGAPLVLFALPDATTQSNRFAVEIPHGAALILTHERDGELKGIDAFPNAHPPVAPVFWRFRIMVGTGVLMLLTSWLGVGLIWRQRRNKAPLMLPRWMLTGLVGMTFSGWLATVAGWYVTEVGRQPYLVYGTLKTAEAASNVPPAHIALTLTAYLIVYVLLIVAYISVLRHMAEKPVEDLSRPVRLPGQKPAATTVATGGE